MNSDQILRDRFVELVAQHQSQIFGFICAMVRNRDDAQDVHQQTLLVLWNKFSQFQPGTNFLSWAFSVAHLEVRRFRGQRRSDGAELSEEVLSLVAEAMNEDARADLFAARQDALSGCLEKLPPRDRDLVERIYGGGERVADLADELGRMPQSVTNSLRRIRRLLFDCIERAVGREGLK